MTFNEFVIETVVEHIMHCDHIDFLYDFGEEATDCDIAILHGVSGSIKRNTLEIYY